MNRAVRKELDAAAQARSVTPVMAQYFDAKARQPGALIFFRMGDFYELFFDDAAAAAAALGIALTHRGAHQGVPIPMAGVPVHAADAYLAKLIRAGFKVAVCEQMEAPEEARQRGGKSIVRRELVRVITPGTLTEDSLLEATGANRLAALAIRAGKAAVASVELSTGKVECADIDPRDAVATLAALHASEILVSDRLLGDPAMAAALGGIGVPIEPLAAALGEPAAAEGRLKRLYGVATLDGFGTFGAAEISAMGLIAAHLETTQAGRAPALCPPVRLGRSEFMIIDPATRASLEIERNLSGGREGTLLATIDRTVTAPGARLLAARLSRPLTSVERIDGRLDAIAWLIEHDNVRRRIRESLKGVGDMPRALSRLALGRGGPRDLKCLQACLRGAQTIGGLLAVTGDSLRPPPGPIADAMADLSPPESLRRFEEALARGLIDDPPGQARDGGFLVAGFCDTFEEARALRDDSRRVMAALESTLAAQTSVPLRLRHNAMLGYFVEVGARHGEVLLRDPWRGMFIHRQTLASQLRFTTPELAELDGKIARAGERALAIEVSVFEAWRSEATSLAPDIHRLADALANLDVAAALADWALDNSASRPGLGQSSAFEVRAGRHPVVEAAVRGRGDPFTANDCLLDGAGQAGPRLTLVTGPNMAGKSTFLRQNALLCILAQAGCYVPARSCALGIVDRLFSRVGAADDLARGRSTFMAEMVETAAILTQATDRSFVILDEIGRGTATYDGLAIAWACVEALHENNRCRALFATHYHELAILEERLSHIANVSLRAKEWNGDLVFLHEAAPGPADRSYGVHVAKLAGVPAAVIRRAREVLAKLERGSEAHAGLRELPLFAAYDDGPAASPAPPSELESSLREIDVDDLSPRQALEAMYRLKSLLS